MIVPPDVESLQSNAITETTRAARTGNRPVVVQEIGGYLAPAIQELAALPGFRGVVEDTKQGHWRYEERQPLPCPVVSIAESPLKALEDQQVGRSLAYAIEGFLRDQFYALLPETKIGLFGFGGIGEATARSLKAHGGRVMVFDQDPVKTAKAMLAGFEVRDREEIPTRADLVLGVSGSRSVSVDDARILSDGAIVASGSSKQVELDVDGLLSEGEVRYDRHAVKEIEIDGKRLHLLNDGMPINFLDQSILGCVLDLVYCELYMSIRELSLGHLSAGLQTLSLEQQRLIAATWCQTYSEEPLPCFD